MTLKEMLQEIHHRIKQECFTDLVDSTGVSAYAINEWRKEPPEKPSLLVFCRLARYCGLNPTLDQLDEII